MHQKTKFLEIKRSSMMMLVKRFKSADLIFENRIGCEEVLTVSLI